MRRFGVRSAVVKGFLAVSVVLALGLVGLITDYVMTNFDRNELQRLQVETLSQREELHLLVVKLEDLRQAIVVLAQNDAKVRVLDQKSTGNFLEVKSGRGGVRPVAGLKDAYVFLRGDDCRCLGVDCGRNDDLDELTLDNGLSSLNLERPVDSDEANKGRCWPRL